MLGIRSKSTSLSQAMARKPAPSRSDLLARSIQVTGGRSGGLSLYGSIAGQFGSAAKPSESAAKPSESAAKPSGSIRLPTKKRTQEGGPDKQIVPQKRKKMTKQSVALQPQAANRPARPTTTLFQIHQSQRGTKEDATSFLQQLQKRKKNDNSQAKTSQSAATAPKPREDEVGNEDGEVDDDDATVQLLNSFQEDSDQEQVEGDNDNNEEVAIKELREMGQCPAEYAGDETDDWNNDLVVNVNINTEMRDSFKAYCERHRKEMLPFLTKEQVLGIKLLDVLKRKKAPMDTYEELMLWHFQSTNQLDEGETLKDLPRGSYIGRESLLKQLKQRYNMEEKFATKRPLELPYSKENLELVCHDAWKIIESLLTDPRVNDDDYLFFGNDPTADPPEEIQYYEDLNTGNAYRAAVKKYKQGHPNRVVLPISLYVDGADTGVMKNLPITAVKLEHRALVGAKTINGQSLLADSYLTAVISVTDAAPSNTAFPL